MKYLLCFKIFQLNLSSSLAIYMLQFERCITCQAPLSSGSLFSTKGNAVAVDRCCSIPLKPILTVQNLLISEKKRLKLQRSQSTTEYWYATKKTSEIRKVLVVKLGSQVSRQRR